jgi:hypothetical protein
MAIVALAGTGSKHHSTLGSRNVQESRYQLEDYHKQETRERCAHTPSLVLSRVPPGEFCIKVRTLEYVVADV